MRPNPALRASSVPPGYDLSSVPKNAQGGVLVSEDELAAAFAFFDVDGSGKIATSNIRKRPKNMPAKNYRFPMKNKPELTLEGLKELLLDNEVANYDPDGTGEISSADLESLLQKIGLKQEAARELIERFDVTEPTTVDFAKFLELVKAGQPDQPGEEPDPVQIGEMRRAWREAARKPAVEAEAPAVADAEPEAPAVATLVNEFGVA